MTINHKNTQEHDADNKSSVIEGFLWVVLVLMILVIGFLMLQRNWRAIQASFFRNEITDFNQVIIDNNFNHMSLEKGQAWDVSYETGKMRSFAGLVRHTSPIHEPDFSILTFDILVTSGDFADETFVQTSVKNHHYTWYAPELNDPKGKINLLHTVPSNEEINCQLSQIQNGDTVMISGYEIYRIIGFDSQGTSVGIWQDSGCNTTLVTEVKILQKKSQ